MNRRSFVTGVGAVLVVRSRPGVATECTYGVFQNESRPKNERLSMRTFAALLALSVASALATGTSHSEEGPPAWAYPVNPSDLKLPADDGTLRRVPDSSAGFTLTQVRDLFFAPDWHPGDHPPMPEIVARGRKPDVRACGVCHRADGPGGPENSGLAGLPAAYIVQQMADFKRRGQFSR
jgi:cytochrome c553